MARELAGYSRVVVAVAVCGVMVLSWLWCCIASWSMVVVVVSTITYRVVENIEMCLHVITVHHSLS